MGSEVEAKVFNRLTESAFLFDNGRENHLLNLLLEFGVQAACADPAAGSVILLENLSWDFRHRCTDMCGEHGEFSGFHIEEEGKNEAKEKARRMQTKHNKEAAKIHTLFANAKADPDKVKDFRASLVCVLRVLSHHATLTI